MTQRDDHQAFFDGPFFDEPATQREPDIEKRESTANRASTEPVAPVRERVAPQPPSQPSWPTEPSDGVGLEHDFFPDSLADDEPIQVGYPATHLWGTAALGAAAAALALTLLSGPGPAQPASATTAPTTTPVNQQVVASILTGGLAPAQEQRALQYLAFVHTDQPVGAWARQQLLPPDAGIPMAPGPAVAPEPAEAPEPAVVERPAVAPEPAEATEPAVVERPAVVQRPAVAKRPVKVEEPVQVAEAAQPSAPVVTAPVTPPQPTPPPVPTQEAKLPALDAFAAAIPEPVAMPAPGLDAALQKLQALRSSDLEPAARPRKVTFAAIDQDLDDDDELLNSALSTARPGVEGCWSNAADAEGLAAGELVLSLSVARGNVEGVSVEDDGIGSADLERCLVRRLGRMRVGQAGTGDAVVTLAFE